MKREEERLQREKEAKEAPKPAAVRNQNTENKRLTYKEKQEFAQLEKDIAALEEEKKQIEAALCGGTISVEEITAMSKRLPELNDELDEKSMRWLELSEFES